MSRPRKLDSKDTRALAIAAAEQLLYQHGYLGVSMELVAKTIGVRKSSLYHHFPDGKEELVHEVAERILASYENRMLRAIQSRRTAAGQLEALVDRRFEQQVPTENTVREAVTHLEESRQRYLWGKFTQHMLAPIEGIFRRGAERGELRPHDPQFAAWAFLALLSQFSEINQRYPQPNLSRKLVGLIMNGLKP